MGALAAYPIAGERFWLKINRVPLALQKLPKAFEGWKIVQFSDTHFGFHYNADHFRQVAKTINELNPDMLFFTGDLLHHQVPDTKDVVAALKQLHAFRGGKWAVLGNHDYNPRMQAIDALEAAGFKVLRNNYGYINAEGQSLYIAGTKDLLYEVTDIDATLKDLAIHNEHACTLLLAHEPDIADLSSQYGFAAQFSGHSHGGQVKLPFVGAVVTPVLAHKYVEGLYPVGDQDMPLYVNRGIGTTGLPIRLFCRPEITIFQLRSTMQSES